MENLGGKMVALGEEVEEFFTDISQKETKAKIDNKMEYLDRLQMLRLAQGEGEPLLRKDNSPGTDLSVDQQSLAEEPAVFSSTTEGKDEAFKHEAENFQITKQIVRTAHISQDEGELEEHVAAIDHDRKPKILIANEQDMGTKIREKQMGVNEESVEFKPALVKKAVSELHGLTERQQKFLQDFHVKFVLRGLEAAEDDQARARQHSSHRVDLKIHADYGFGEASDIDITVKGQIDAKPSYVTPRTLATTQTSEPERAPQIRVIMDDVIDNLADVTICNLDPSAGCDSKPTPDFGNAMKDLVDDDELSELQGFTDREGRVGECQCYGKAGKQMDEKDESDVQITNASYSVLNVVCPVSGVPVVGLKDPVRSEGCEHVYDRASALNYISSMEKDGFCPCAVVVVLY
ncbi:uncharacterized protein [Physcomitrium patens]|uniref:uncharacterized protein isoform X2 n=1 Tax=Physcomitrium patens TaxID=3218 RepID=UPI003CCD8277